jgi:hypothetical protein
MGEPQISPIPQCDANWDRLSPGAQKIIQGWLDDGQYERIETYVYQLLNPPTSTAMLGNQSRGGGRSSGDPATLDYSDRTYHLSTEKVLKKIGNMRGECYYGFLAWVRDKEEPFSFAEMKSAGDSQETSVRGCLRKMILKRMVFRHESHRPSAKGVYQKVPGCEPMIDDLLKRVPRFQTQKDVLIWIAKTKGEYFTFGDIREEVEGRDSTISATISNLVRNEFLQAQQWKKGCKIYRLTPD